MVDVKRTTIFVALIMIVAADIVIDKSGTCMW